MIQVTSPSVTDCRMNKVTPSATVQNASHRSSSWNKFDGLDTNNLLQPKTRTEHEIRIVMNEETTRPSARTTIDRLPCVSTEEGWGELNVLLRSHWRAPCSYTQPKCMLLPAHLSQGVRETVMMSRKDKVVNSGEGFRSRSKSQCWAHSSRERHGRHGWQKAWWGGVWHWWY